MTKQHIKVPSGTTSLIVPCVVCDHERLVAIHALRRGAGWICDKCGAHNQATKTTQEWSDRFAVRYSRNCEETFLDVFVRRDGVWIFIDEVESSVLEVLDYESDRSIAIIIGSMIESRLERTILNRFRRSRKIESQMFRPGGPLGTFGNKIDLAYLLGILTEAAHRDLQTFKDIRNLFAHDLSIASFSSQKIKSRTANLKLIETEVAEHEKEGLPPSDKASSAFNATNKSLPALFVRHSDQRKKVPRKDIS